MKTGIHGAFALVFALASGSAALAQEAGGAYPSQAVKVVVSYAAGNTTDVLGRLIGERLSQVWKQPVVIENRPGVAGSLGAAQVARSRADGNTLLFTAVAAMAVNPHVYAQVGYDPR